MLFHGFNRFDALPPTSGLRDFPPEAQSAIAAQLWRFQHGQGFSSHFQNQSEYQSWGINDLIQLLQDVVHSTIYLKNRTLNQIQVYHATQEILIEPVIE